ncbi:hypothetical protein [Desulfogranum japonicum]|uniref:hypothetical protein n=1 Tax=Desulfogranum japonicum TaxID=231447 RepID=UPI0004264757|nr:hypothetical protein [Desulfogranum japonicum]
MTSNKQQLLQACRVLFDDQILISWEFVNYLQQAGVIAAFKKRAFELHPDRMNSETMTKCGTEHFVRLCGARDLLLQHIQERDSVFAERPKHIRKMSNICNMQTASVSRSSTPLFGRFLHQVGAISLNELIRALTWQKMTRPKIGQLAVAQGYIDRAVIVKILRHGDGQKTFGVKSIELGIMVPEQVKSLLYRQRRMQKKIGQYFVEHNMLSREEVWGYLRQLRNENMQQRPRP